MKEKFFSFKAVADDPKPLDIDVSTDLFLVKSGKILRPSNASIVDFDPEDIIYFDEDFGGTLNISFNDLLHGTYSIEERELDIGEDNIFIVKRIKYIDLKNNEKNVLLKIDVIKGGLKETVYMDNRYFLKPWKQRAKVIAEKLGIDEQTLKNFVKWQKR